MWFAKDPQPKLPCGNQATVWRVVWFANPQPQQMRTPRIPLRAPRQIMGATNWNLLKILRTMIVGSLLIA